MRVLGLLMMVLGFASGLDEKYNPLGPGILVAGAIIGSAGEIVAVMRANHLRHIQELERIERTIQKTSKPID